MILSTVQWTQLLNAIGEELMLSKCELMLLFFASKEITVVVINFFF